MIRECPVCGKKFDVLYPELWRYREGNMWICTWKCLRKIRKENEGDMYVKTKKDGTPAKKSGPRPRAAEEKPQPIGGGDWEKIPAPEAKVKLDGAVRIETKEPEKVTVTEPEWTKYEPEKKEEITKPVGYDGFTVRAVQGVFGRYSYSETRSAYIDYENNDGDELSMTVEQWRNFLDELKRAALVLGVEL